MYIRRIHIENFRNFKYIDIPLNQFTIVVGENDAGKSNLLDAIRLVLNNNSLQYISRSLSITDINKDAVKEFQVYLQENKNEISDKLNEKDFMQSVYKKIPVVKVRLATVYKGNIIKNLIMDCQSYTKYRPNETTGGIFVSWRRKEELPTGA